MKNKWITFLRVFIALWYLLGWISHVILGLFNPEVYSAFTSTILVQFLKNAWVSIILPNITLFALILAVYEIFVGLLLINKDKSVKYGLVGSIAFNLFLVILGLGIPAESNLADFVSNRLPNLFFIMIQIPLLFGAYENSVLELIKGRWFKNRVK